jgi:hypothetical protein
MSMMATGRLKSRMAAPCGFSSAAAWATSWVLSAVGSPVPIYKSDAYSPACVNVDGCGVWGT